MDTTSPLSSTSPVQTALPLPAPAKLLTVHEVAVLLRVDDTTVRRWIKAGILEAVPLPHTGHRRGHRIKVETLDSLLKIRH